MVYYENWISKTTTKELRTITDDLKTVASHGK